MGEIKAGKEGEMKSIGRENDVPSSMASPLSKGRTYSTASGGATDGRIEGSSWAMYTLQ